jgi:hypothetical protein
MNRSPRWSYSGSFARFRATCRWDLIGTFENEGAPRKLCIYLSLSEL